MTRRTAEDIDESRAQRAGARDDPRLEWWRASRFGAFIHWGLYSLADRWSDGSADDGGWTQEWVQKVRRIPCAEYAKLGASFNPESFDPAAWVSLFREAGQRYVVITAKHHDGFCLFRSGLTDFNVVDSTPFGRDVVAELAEACAQQGMRLGVYYSQTQDWRHGGGYGNDWDYSFDEAGFDRYVREYAAGQVEELLTKYGPIALVWFDTPMVMTREQSVMLVDLVRRLQPACLVNGRIGNAMGDYATSRDNQYLKRDIGVDWECPATMNDTWGYRAGDENWKSVDELYMNLKEVMDKGGNYLLNVGPDEHGRIPEASAARLRALGARLRAEGWEAGGLA